MMVDPGGEIFVIANSTEYPEFKKQVESMISTLKENKLWSKAMEQLENDKNRVVIIAFDERDEHQFTPDKDYYESTGNAHISSILDGENVKVLGTLNTVPDIGYEVTTESGDKGTLTPLEIFYHELGHAINYYESRTDYVTRAAQTLPVWDNKEEKYTTEKYEHVIVRVFQGPIREHHRGTPVYVTGPESRKHDE